MNFFIVKEIIAQVLEEFPALTFIIKFFYLIIIAYFSYASSVSYLYFSIFFKGMFIINSECTISLIFFISDQLLKDGLSNHLSQGIEIFLTGFHIFSL